MLPTMGKWTYTLKIVNSNVNFQPLAGDRWCYSQLYLANLCKDIKGPPASFSSRNPFMTQDCTKLSLFLLPSPSFDSSISYLKCYCPPLKLKVRYHSVTFLKLCQLTILFSRSFYRNQCCPPPQLLVPRLSASWATDTETAASLLWSLHAAAGASYQTLDHSLAQNFYGLCTV